ncbi:MAG: septum formation initiator family protein [Rhodobacter sp.]|nr:septum formation initiator family protein [Rhodobacter sp.]
MEVGRNDAYRCTAESGGLVYFALAFTLGAYFTFAAVQGDYGVFRRVEISAEAEALRAERDKLTAELAEVQNLTRRLSDAWLDLDLLDQQAREVLGYMRADEIAIR